MPTPNLDLQRVRDKRLRIISLLALSLTTVLSSISILWMYFYGIPLYISVPFVIASSSLGILGSASLFTMFFGVYAALKPVHKDRFNPLNNAVDLKPETRIAVLMPVYHEDPRRVTAAMAAMISEMTEFKEASHFEWFLLSDSRNENIIVQEQYAVYCLQEQFPDTKIIYRQRIMNTAAKVGNTSDFFRRWGGHYKFAVVFDADSIMPAKTMVDMAKTIEGGERIGLIQSISYEINSNTLYGRMRSFGFNMGITVGFAAQYYFRMARCSFYGHNAIIRTQAIVSHCNLPILSKAGPFAGGKPSSHDFFEAVLLEGAGYETWLLPTLVSFDDQIQNIVDAMKRETRWIYGAMDWLRLFRLRNLSSFGKANLLISCLHYFNTVTGLIFFIVSFIGSSYVFRHPIFSYMLLMHYKNIFLFAFFIFIFSMVSPFALFSFYQYKKGEISRLGGIIKFAFSYLLSLFMGMIIAPMNMILINMILISWASGKKMVWDAQNRGNRVLSWKECFNNFWKISIFGFLLLYFAWNNILAYATPKTLLILNMSIGWVYFWILTPIVGLILSPFVARFTSRVFPWMEKAGWLRHAFENPADEYPVVRETKRWNDHYDLVIPNDMSFSDALRNPKFALRHMVELPSRPAKFLYWNPRLRGRRVETLTRLEKLVIFRCRELWEMFMIQETL